MSNKRVVALLAWALLCLGLVTSQALAANGKIAGVVKDQSTGEVLPGVNITTLVGGATIGTTTDGDGRYFLLNLSPGIYAVKASLVGFQAVEKTDVRVRMDLTTEVDFALSQQAIEGDVITVVAERPLIEKTLTSSRTSIDASEINNTMPVADLANLVDTSPSSFRGFVRGGRKSESKILVDGIDVSDSYFRAGEGTTVYSPYTSANRSTGGEFGVGVNLSSVQSLDIISGTFNAEYDAATAGVISVVTREGGDRVEGRLFMRAGSGVKNAGPDVYNNTVKNGQTVQSDLEKYNLERQTLLNSGDATNIAKANNFYTFDQATIDQMGYGKGPREAELSVGGPLGKQAGFYLTTRYNKRRLYLPHEHNLSMRYSLKLTYKPTDNLKLTGNTLIDDEGKLGNWVNRDFAARFKFYPAGYPGNKKMGAMGYLGVTHTLSPRTFYEVKISQLNRTTELGYSDDNGDGRLDQGETGDFVVLSTSELSNQYLGVNGTGILANGRRSFFTPDPGNERFFTLGFSNNAYRIGQPGFYYEDIDRNAFQLKADVTSQLNHNHQIKAGMLYRYHTISQFQQRTQVRVTYDNNFPFEITDWTLHPKEYAVYVQDRMEYQGIIINAGLRLDGFDVGAKSFTDFFAPTRQETLGNGQIVRTEIRDRKVDVRWYLQPRLGISHPITENAAMHYSWGKFYSAPAFSNLFDNYGVFANPSLPFIVDVAADPVEATAYEIGLQYGIDRNHLVDVTAYYRDVKNYGRIGYAINPVAGLGYGSYTFQTSFGYADARGVEISFERRPGSPWISGRANYAFSYVKAASGAGGASPYTDKSNYSAVADGGKDIPFDDRYTFNTVQLNVSGGGNPLITGYDRKHRLGLTLTGDFSSLTPGEGDQLLLTGITTLNSGFFYRIQETTTDLRDREVAEGPWTFQTDLRLTYGFHIDSRRTASAFVEVRNLFDRKNIISYDNATNNSRRLWETDGDPTGELNRAYSDEGFTFYDIPREVNFGVSVDF